MINIFPFHTSNLQRTLRHIHTLNQRIIVSSSNPKPSSWCNSSWNIPRDSYCRCVWGVGRHREHPSLYYLDNKKYITIIRICAYDSSIKFSVLNANPYQKNGIHIFTEFMRISFFFFSLVNLCKIMCVIKEVVLMITVRMGVERFQFPQYRGSKKPEPKLSLVAPRPMVLTRWNFVSWSIYKCTL